MAFHSFRLRRAFSLSSSLLHNALHHQPKPIFPLAALPRLLPAAAAASSTNKLAQRQFTSTTSLYLSSERKVFDPETDEIGPDTILFEGCDYNHWLITIDFPKDANLTREQMIETYVNTAAQVFGSVEEAKKKIYALSTTTYQGFQVECSEETSKKFEGLPGVVFILPDSYIDPVNKEYGGDKYVNGEIFPRPPPVHYGRNFRDRRPREQTNYGPPPQQRNYGLPQQQQSYGPPPPRQTYGPPQQQQNYGPPPPRQDFGPPPPQQNFGPPPPQQNFGPPPPQQNFGPPPPQQEFGPPPPRQEFGPPPPRQEFGPPRQQQNFGTPPPQQNFGPPPPQQDFGPPPPQHNFGPPTAQHNYGPPKSQQTYGPPQPQQQNYWPPPPQHNYGPPPPPPPQQQHYRPPPTPQHGEGQRDFQHDNLQNNVPFENKGFP